jgi:eukaryotic-like serine/threonine-protein kinase
MPVLGIGSELGKYRILEQIGAGSMAEVYKALQLSVNRTVAIKVMSPHLLNTDPQFLMRFRQEAWIVAALEHPYILPVIDFGEQREILYLVLRFVNGGTLRDLLKVGSLSWPVILRYVKEIGEALDYAHGLGFVHRDIKPGNVLLDVQGNPFVADFGLAKIVGGGSITQSGVGMIGTPHYMSPEQGLGRPVDGRSDLYALGIMLYEMLTGQVPYDADSTVGIVMKHINAPVPSVLIVNPELPPAMDGVLTRVLAKSPSDRYHTAAEFTEALSQAFGTPAYAHTIRSASDRSGKDAPTVLEASQQTTYALQQLGQAVGQGLKRRAGGLGERLYTRWSGWVGRLQKSSTVRQRRLLLAGTGLLALAVVLGLLPAIFRALPVYPKLTPTSPSVSITASLLRTVNPRPTPLPIVVTVAPTLTSVARTAGPTVPPIASAIVSPTQPPPTPTAVTETRRVAAKDGMTVIYIPAGDFLLGAADSDSKAQDDEKPQQKIYLDAFWIDRLEVTVAQFQDFVTATGYQTDAEKGCCEKEYSKTGGMVYAPIETWAYKASWLYPQGPTALADGGLASPQRPVVQVSWNDARAYCAWAGRRLPTEAEWEKAARGADGLIYPWGMTFDPKRLNFCDMSCVAKWKDLSYEDSYARTSPAGVFAAGASPYGVLDMAGNVWEWVNDFYDFRGYYRYPTANPPGVESGRTRVLRGGSWIDTVDRVRATARSSQPPDARNDVSGFRCAADGTTLP